MTATGIVGEYQALRAEADADLLAMQMGDFYEFFGADARTVGDELDLKVSERSSGGETYEMAGVPVDELDPYLTALVERGYRVAVADQVAVEDGHERRLSRVVTPGTLLEPSDDAARHLASVVAGEEGYGLALLDVTTGRFRVTQLDGPDADDRVRAELYRAGPTEVVPGPTLREDEAVLTLLRDRLAATVTSHDPEAFAPGRARVALREQFGEAVTESVGIADRPLAVRAAGAAVDYVAETGTGVLASVTRVRPYGAEDHVALDATTQRTLELVSPMTEGGTPLLDVLDHTVTSAGGRLLAERLVRPTRDRAELERRLDTVEALAGAAMARDRLADHLEETADLARLASRAASGSLDADGLLRVRATLAVVPELVEAVEGSPRLADSPVADRLAGLDRAAAAELRAALGEALADPGADGEGRPVRPAADESLAEVVADLEAAREWVDDLADRERERLGVSRLTVDRNKTDGHYVQVPKSETDAVPDSYEGIRTLKNAERYVLPALTERAREIRRLEERRAELERAVIEELRGRVADAAELLQSVGRALADLDVAVALADHAARNDWTRPTLTDERTIAVEAGRHPVVEQTTEFVPNDLSLDRDRRFLLVTGPNMSGKSTYMRQAALLVLLAQVGSFVPAAAARLGPVDGIYTRVGALDELAGGRSTFMVEMQELSNILHSATADSLVVLDEVGRGTATYDGISIAWAATEYLHNTVGATTLFATHYHELTRLAEHLAGVANVHLAAEERDGDVTFRRTVTDGPADRSYGVHVAELAGVPAPVVDRADEVLGRLRADEALSVRGGTAGDGTGTGEDDGGDGEETHQVVFDVSEGALRPGGAAGAEAGEDGGPDPEEAAVLEALRELDVEGTAPLELARRLRDLQARLDGDDADDAGGDPTG